MAREFSLLKTRNIGVMAHIDAGKTTFSERLLYHTGKIHKIGETHDGAAQMDWMEQEQERGITITSAATTATWKEHRINVIDTPGHVDFTVEVSRSLRVLDGAVTVLDAQAGVEPQTETVWRQATDYLVPRLVFVNKMDKTGADFKFSCESLHKRLGANAHAIQYPIGAESDFRGIVDLVTMKAFLYKEGNPDEEGTEIEIPAEIQDDVELYRDELLNALSDFDDELAMAYLEGEEISEELIKATIRKATLSVKFFPVCCGTAFKNKGVKKVLDAVIDYLPSPVEVAEIKGQDEDGNEVIVASTDEEPFAALAFKVMTDPFVGKLTFFRVYRGKLESGSYILNATKGKRERVGRILQMHANNRTEIKEVFSGDIAAAVGLKDTVTGDSMCDVNCPVILESMIFPEPVISVAIEPKSKNDQDKMSTALLKLAEEDPTFRTYTNENGQTIISGMGELHLDIIVDRMKREFRVEANVGAPQVSYRETIRKAAEVQGKFVRQSGGRGQYGDAVVVFEPNPGKGFEFVDEIVGGVVPKEYIPAVQKGIENALPNGNLAGYPTIDIKARLVFGSYHDVDSSQIAFEVAGGLAFKESAKKCDPVLLEPIMSVEVVIPDEYLGNVIGDLSSRRGRIEGQENHGHATSVKGFVPLAQMFGYATALRSNTQGRGTFTMQFDHYEECPRSIAEEIIKNRQ